MKKHFFLMALMAIAPLALISCGDDDDESAESTPKVNLSTPAYKDNAAKFTIDNVPTKLNGKDILLTGLEFTESGYYLITYREAAAATRTDNFDLSYYMSKYIMSSESDYTLSDFGHVKIAGKSGNNYLLLVKSAGEEEFEVPATPWNGNVKPGTETDYLCRTWTITNTRLMGTVMNNGKTIKLGRDFPGECDLNQIIDYAKEQGANITDYIDDNSIVKGVTFTEKGTYLLNFNRSTYDVGEWRWTDMTKGLLSYTWNNPTEMGNPLESGIAQVAFANNECKLTLKSTVSEFDLEMICTMH